MGNKRRKKGMMRNHVEEDEAVESGEVNTNKKGKIGRAGNNKNNE